LIKIREDLTFYLNRRTIIHSMKREKVTILLADDDPHILFFLKHTVQNMKIPVQFTHFKNGEQLLEFLEMRRDTLPRENACILLDLNMPRKDGRETLAEMHARGLGAGLPVALLSHSGLTGDETDKLGADIFLGKPIGLEEYKAFVEKIVQLAGSGHVARRA
jgi:CheY-like chemotaxis protein